MTYAYDADNRLIRHFVDPAGDEGFEPAEQTIFIYRGGQVEMQFEGPGGEGNISLFDLYHRFLWGPGVDMLLADEQIVLNDEQTDFEGTTYWTLGDHLGSIRDVVDVEGNLRLHRAYDSFGNVVDEVHYNASGVEINEGSAGYVDVQFSYTGKFFDKATGLQNNWNRWYDPRTGKWTSEDPIGFDGKDPNLNRYVDNTPTQAIDPAGKEKKLPSFASKRLTDDILIRVDKGPQVYGGFEIHVYTNKGIEVAKIDGKGHWCSTHKDATIMKPSEFKAKFGAAIKELRAEIRHQAHSAAEAGWRTGRRVTAHDAAKIGLGSAAAFGLMMDNADALDTISKNRNFGLLIRSCEAGDLRMADIAANNIGESLLFKARNEHWYLGWTEAWKQMRKELAKEIDEMDRANKK